VFQPIARTFMYFGHRLFVTLLACSTFVGTAVAQDLSNTAAGTALSGAVRSAAVGPTALAYNPAAMHQVLQYSLDTGYHYNAPASGHAFTASVVDSKTNPDIAAGMSYTYIMDESFGSTGALADRVGHMIRAGLASGYRTEGMALHIGMGIAYLDSKPKGNDRSKAFTLDAGALLVVNNMFRLGVVGHNLVDSKTTELPRRLGIGASLLVSGFLASFDAVLDFETLEETTPQYSVGLEYSVAERFPLRVGYQFDQIVDAQYISGGIGFVAQTMGFEFGFRQNIENKEDSFFAFNLRAYLP